MSKFADTSVEDLQSLRTEKHNAFAALVALENPTAAQVDEAEALANEIDEIDSEVIARAAAETERAEKFAALRNRKFGVEASEQVEETANDPAEDESEEDDSEESADEADAETAEEATTSEPEAEPSEPQQTASAKTAKASTKTIAELATKVKRPSTPKKADMVSITAAADVPKFTNGQSLDDLSAVAQAVINRAKGFGVPTGNGETVALQQFGTAVFSLDYPEDLVVDRHDDAMEVMDRAVQESRLPGGSLVAAGGWCAPSETIYDLTDDSTTEGMISLPEIAVRRGGIRYAQSPTFADFYANPGFIQTEAQAIAGTTKPCIEVDCPDFTEVRLDAEGICIKVPILTNAAYPEVVRNFVSGSLTAHQHWINANVINRLVTASGAARVFTGLGSTYSDSIEALGLVIDQTRQKYRLGMKATVEAVVPFWVRNAFRADLSRRTGRPTGQVTDAEIDAQFASIGANVQYVYDWQMIDETAETYPASFNALVYPAGTFVKGTSDVINLNTVYDAASLATNVYTGLFMEQGLLVAKKKFHSDLVTLPICNAGRTGAADFTCTVGP